MNKKCSFFTKNIIKKVLFLLMGIVFITEIAQCAILPKLEEEEAWTSSAPKLAHDQIPHVSVFRDSVEEEIGTQTHGQITELPIQSSSKYEQIDWWLSVLPVIKQTARIDEFDTYEKIVKRSLNQIGLIYKLSETEYIGQIFADGLGLGIVSNDFETAFNKKLEEFKLFSIRYLDSKIAVKQKPHLDVYHSNEDLFSYMIQKTDLHNVEKYEIIHIGDLHGDLISLLTILKNYEKFFNKDFSLRDKSKIFVCSGDVIDRGQFGLEVLFILMSLKIKNPDNVFLSLGNHEASHTFLAGYDQGFAREVTQKFNFGQIDFSEKKIIFSPGAEQFAKFMKKLQVNVFRYLPSALFIKTEFGNILFCHGLPDHTDTLAQIFLRLPENIQIAFGNQHPQDTRFTDSDLEVEAPTTSGTQTDIRSEKSQSLQAIGKYMDKLDISLCMRGHQHNQTIGAIFDVYSGGVIMHQASESSFIITTLSLDFACYMPSLQKIGKIGNYACCCTLEKDRTTLSIQGISINRYTAERVNPIDRINPEFKIHSIDPSVEKSEKITPTGGIESADEIERKKISQLCIEVDKLKVSGPQIFGCPNITTLQAQPLWVVENFHSFFSQIQNMYKIDINMIYELFFLLGIMSQDGSLSVSKSTTLSPESKLILIQIMRDKAQGPFQLISNIKELRKELASYVFKINDPKKFNSKIKDCLYRINQNRFSLGQKLCDIIRIFESIQGYLNQTDEPKNSIAKKLKDLVPNPEILTFEHILLAILGKPEQEAV